MREDETTITEQTVAENLFDVNEKLRTNYHAKRGGVTTVTGEKVLKLPFRNIARMEDNLCGYGRITTLLLNNNRIEEIRGLEHLVHLKRLDLSFNFIAKIEGLDTLTQLEQLSFFVSE